MCSRFVLRNVLVLSALFLAAASCVQAQTYYIANTVVTSAVNDDVVIGYANQADLGSKANPASPTITLAATGGISGGVDVYNQSVFTINDSVVGYILDAHNTSVINFNGGSVYNMYVSDNAQLNRSKGAIQGFLSVEDNAVANLDAGSIGTGLGVSNHGTVNMSGGTSQEIYVQDSGTINLFGPSLTAALLDPQYHFGTTVKCVGE